MGQFKVRVAIILIILGIFAALFLVIELQETVRPNAVDIALFPAGIGEWQSNDYRVEARTKDILETDAILIRTYSRAGHDVDLAIVYYSSSRVSLHLPESCSIGQGTFITERNNIFLGTDKEFSANELVIRGHDGDQLVVYYFETQELKTASYRLLRWNMMISDLRRRPTGAGLIRFSLPIETDLSEARRVIREFITEAAPAVTEYLFGSYQPQVTNRQDK